jgi:hypothetical protein
MFLSFESNGGGLSLDCECNKSTRLPLIVEALPTICPDR